MRPAQLAHQGVCRQCTVIVGRRARGAHEALPHTPPGDKPPETPGPLSLGIYVPERKESVKGSQAAQKPRALDRFLPFRRATGMRERGPLGGGSSPPHHATKDYGPLKPKTSCRGDLRRGTTTSGPGRGPMAGFEVTLYGRICSDHRGFAKHWGETGGTRRSRNGEIWVRMGNSRFERPHWT